MVAPVRGSAPAPATATASGAVARLVSVATCGAGAVPSGAAAAANSPVPAVAEVLRADTGSMTLKALSAGVIPATWEAASVTDPVEPLPPDEVRHDSDSSPGAVRAHNGLAPSCSSVPISMPLSPTRY